MSSASNTGIRIFQGWLCRDARENEFALRHGEGLTRFTLDPGQPGNDISQMPPESVLEVRAQRLGAEGWQALDWRVLARAETWPVAKGPEAPAALARSRWRYLAFREGPLREALLMRHRFVQSMSAALAARGFIGVETPLLAMPSASGAREFRAHGQASGAEYALPQSAQLYGQLAVAGGIERYFQWSRCFRDEDLRTNRQPEFTQLHLECAFADAPSLRRLFETLLGEASAACGVPLQTPFPEWSHTEVMARFGHDKPDPRYEFALRIVPVSITGPGRPPAGDGQRLAHFSWYADARLDDAVLSALHGFCASAGIEILGYLDPAAWSGGFKPQYAGADELRSLPGFSVEPRPGLYPLLWGEKSSLNEIHRSIYCHVSSRRVSLPHAPRCVWIVDYPMFEVDAEKPDRLAPVNSPYVAPADNDQFAQARKHRDRLRLNSSSFDLVCNGEEVASGSTVITDMAMQRAVFDAMGLSRQAVRAGYGVWLEALRYGVPPMSGLGLGLDRFMACLTGSSDIRSVMAFPKSKQGHCPVTGSFESERLSAKPEPRTAGG